jgi:hypothetical protein
MGKIKKGIESGRAMVERSPIFEETVRHYREQLARVPYAEKASVLGVTVEGEEALVPLLMETYRVSPRGIRDSRGIVPPHALQVLLYRYLLSAPAFEPQGEDWVTYKDFKDAAPFVGGFINNTEKALIRRFGDKPEELLAACQKVGGYPAGWELSYRIVYRFDLLPKVPLVLLFNEADEEFPAQCTLLYQKKAQAYLDMECLAILGWHLTDSLIEAAGTSYRSIM